MKEYCKIYFNNEKWELENKMIQYSWGEVTGKVTREAKDKSGNTYNRHFLTVVPTDKKGFNISDKNIHIRDYNDSTLNIINPQGLIVNFEKRNIQPIPHDADDSKVMYKWNNI